jgi:hypothetical protein
MENNSQKQGDLNCVLMNVAAIVFLVAGLAALMCLHWI